MPTTMDDLLRALRKEPAFGGAGEDSAKALTVEELLGKFITAPIPIGTPLAQGYGPNGSQLNFTGGSPFPVDDRPAAFHNGMAALKEMANVLGELRKKRATAAATPKATAAGK